jgi:hypothetical protein
VKFVCHIETAGHWAIDEIALMTLYGRGFTRETLEMTMQTDNSKGTTVAPTPKQGQTPTPQQTGGGGAAPDSPKTVTDHQHGSTGKPAGCDEN